MKKKIAAVVSAAVICAAVAACFGMTGCSSASYEVNVIREVCTSSSGYQISYAQVIEEGKDYGSEKSPAALYIDDVYMFTVPNSSYNYIIYVEDTSLNTSFVYVWSAYEDSVSNAYSNLISHDDLETIAEAEAKYDDNKGSAATEIHYAQITTEYTDDAEDAE